MRSRVFEVVLLLWAVACGDAFMTGTSFSCRALSSAKNSGLVMSTPSGGFGTRRDLLRTTGVAVGGVLGSALLPAGALAATDTTQKPKVFTTDGGVKFIVLKEGTGPVAQEGDYCVVEFTGFLRDGRVFDASNAPGRKPVAFKLGSRQVIKGWEEVVHLMNPGAQVQMVVPADMAFGDKGICIENGDCLVKPGEEVRYDLQLKRVAPAY